MPEVNTGMGFPDVAGLGKTVTIKGQMTVRSATAVERVGIGALTEQASDAVVAGGRTWRMAAVPPPAGLELAGPPPRNDPAAWEREHPQGGWVIRVTEERAGAGVPLTFVPMAVKVIDGAGKVVWDGAVDRQMNVRVYPGAVKKPLRAEIVAAKETADSVVGFEIKDVPVPAAEGEVGEGLR
jgi:hypothetical protein